MILRVVRRGVDTRLVDAPRSGRRGLGVGPGGPADIPSWEVANAIVGNLVSQPALEVTMSGPTLQSDGGACRLALFGAPMSMTVGTREAFAGRSFLLKSGEVLRVGGTAWGMRAYLACEGGFAETDDGHYRVSPARDALELGLSGETGEWLFGGSAGDELRIIDGPQADRFQPDALLDTAWKVSTQSTRMGVRLEGTPLARPAGREMLSEMVLPGTVQVTGEGLPIVLGVDAQTIGGYPKVAQTIAADLWKVAQLRPGRAVRFVRVGAADAERLAREQRMIVSEWRTRIAARRDGR